MRLLLDTHVLLWWLAGDATLSPEAKQTIASRENIVFVSSASAWEIAIKKALGKLKAPDDLEEAMNLNQFEMLPITIKHALGISHLPLHHQDPFDRLLISQIKLEALTLVTRDEQLSKYNIPIINA